MAFERIRSMSIVIRVRSFGRPTRSKRNDREVENRLTPKAQELVMLINFTCKCGSRGLRRAIWGNPYDPIDDIKRIRFVIAVYFHFLSVRLSKEIIASQH